MIFANRIIRGDIRSAARLVRDIEDEIPTAREELKKIYPYTGNAYTLGITGSPGTGRSTLVDKLVQALREPGENRGCCRCGPNQPLYRRGHSRR